MEILSHQDRQVTVNIPIVPKSKNVFLLIVLFQVKDRLRQMDPFVIIWQ